MTGLVAAVAPWARHIGDGIQVVCIDCGVVRLVAIGGISSPYTWTCPKCEKRRATYDAAPRDELGRRVCAECRRPIARLNMGPFCFAHKESMASAAAEQSAAPPVRTPEVEADKTHTQEGAKGNTATEHDATQAGKRRAPRPKRKTRRHADGGDGSGRRRLSASNEARMVARYYALRECVPLGGAGNRVTSLVGREFGVSSDTVLRAVRRARSGDDSISPADAAREMGVSRSAVHRWIRDGVLQTTGGYKSRRISMATLRDFMAKNGMTPTGEPR